MSHAGHYETAAEDRLSISHKVIYGLGAFTNNLLAAAIGTMVIVLNLGLGMNPVLVSLIRWDMINGLVGVNDSSGPVDAPRYGENALLLPSFAMSLGLDDNQVLRFSASKTMARPDLFSLSSQIDIGSRDFFQLTAQAGNPDLDPLQSTNLDISYENYYAAGSYFAVNFFNKDIKDFIGTRTTEGQNINGFGNYDQPLYVEERKQLDASYQFRYTGSTTLFLEVSNITDEPTRLYARHPEMLFLSQDHGPVYKFGVRTNF